MTDFRDPFGNQYRVSKTNVVEIKDGLGRWVPDLDTGMNEIEKAGLHWPSHGHAVAALRYLLSVWSVYHAQCKRSSKKAEHERAANLNRLRRYKWHNHGNVDESGRVAGTLDGTPQSGVQATSQECRQEPRPDQRHRPESNQHQSPLPEVWRRLLQMAMEESHVRTPASEKPSKQTDDMGLARDRVTHCGKPMIPLYAHAGYVKGYECAVCHVYKDKRHYKQKSGPRNRALKVYTP
jgi:hypothetical protein